MSHFGETEAFFPESFLPEASLSRMPDEDALRLDGYEIALAESISEQPKPILRVIGDPRMRFIEDPLRILRGCKLASVHGLFIDPATLHAMKTHKMRLVNVPIERIVEEVQALLLGDYVHDTLMQTVDVLVAVLPEIAACRNFEQLTPYHIYDVWEHIAWVVQYCPAEPLIRWAALLHDIGKPSAGFVDGGRAHFYGHAALSRILAKNVVERFGFEPAFADKVLTLVWMHDDTIAATPSEVKAALSQMNGDVDLFRTLCKLKRADALSQSELAQPRLQLAADLERVLDELENAPKP